MPEATQLPDLRFPTVKFGGRETPWNLVNLLYKGGAAAKSKDVERQIRDGVLGFPQVERISLVIKLHEEINASLASGGARVTASQTIRHVRKFFQFSDEASLQLSFDTVEGTYCAWGDHLLQRTNSRRGAHRSRLNPIENNTAYLPAAMVGTLLDRILERNSNIIELTGLVHKKSRKSATGVKTEKQSLSATFAFGSLLQDICDGLSVTVVLNSPLPFELNFRDGRTARCNGDPAGAQRVSHHTTLGERYAIANLRIEAELLMFIGQTGMNLSQALNLELRHFAYVSHLDGYQVKERKARRGGAVLFEIFKEYKSHFERYLAWRRQLFPDTTLLFPFVGFDGSRQERRYSGHRLRAVCKHLPVKFVSPRALRNSRVNWLLRISGDPDLAADIAQHTKETLLSVYERPSLQRAITEVIRFWGEVDPHLNITQSVAPGGCNGQVERIESTPETASRPDCVKISGCLWCGNHRDIDSFDYVWAMVSFMHLKVIESSKARGAQDETPSARTEIDRISEKLRWFKQSSEEREGWLSEAQMRLIEGDYHPSFRVEIEELEGGS